VTKRLFLTLVVFLFAIIGVLPLLFMLFKSVMADGELNLSIFTEILATGHQWVLMYHSLTLAFAVALLSTLVGFPLGILFGKQICRFAVFSQFYSRYRCLFPRIFSLYPGLVSRSV